MQPNRSRSLILDSLPTPLRAVLRNLRSAVLIAFRTIVPAKVISHRGIRLFLDPALGSGPLKSLRKGQYEGGELAAIERFIRKDDVVLEMGTGIGFITLFCAKIVGANNVHTFEANSTLEPKIRKNFELNDLHPNLNFAILGAAEKTVDFYCEPEYWSSSKINRSTESKRVTVQQIPVNEVMQRIRPSMLVIDIEGAECELVPIMNLNGVKRVMIEFHAQVTGQEQVDATKECLVSQGFAARWVCPDNMHYLFERA